ncbi:MAG: LytTR family transcriptional regulator [Bacteroidetes bacterium]|nr:LytTR family transcriptional regulator [Bacteroidota bacterium]
MLQSNPFNISQTQEADNSLENNQPKPSGHIFLKAAARLLKIYPEEILWIEALGDYVVINTIKEKYTIHSTMKGIELKLPSEDFIRVHRSFIVRIDQINAIEGKILVIDKKLIPVSKSYKKGLINRLNLL